MKTDSYGYYANSDLVKTVGNFAYRYDENGNLVEKGDTFTHEGDEITIQPKGDYYLYEYDLLNRLVSVSKPGETGGLEIAVSYRYNHNNLRVERTDAEGTTRYVYDLDGNVLEEHRDGELTRYAYRKGKHLAKFTPNETYFYGTDHLGSTTVMTDSNGEVVWRGYISPFGDSATGEGSVEEAVKFTGKELDPETGLYYFNARWYDPKLGKFITEDPARDGINWYVYVLNNPLRFIDPSGLELKINSVDGSLDDDFMNEVETALQNIDPSAKVDRDTGLIYQDEEIGYSGHEKGNSLINRMIEDDNSISIIDSRDEKLDSISTARRVRTRNMASAEDYGKASENGVGSDGYALWNPDRQFSPPTLQPDGTIQDEARPSFIGLGHELIHGDHYQRGTYSQEGESDYLGLDNNIHSANMEERNTVGVGGNNNALDVTENDLRSESSINPRAFY